MCHDITSSLFLAIGLEIPTTQPPTSHAIGHITLHSRAVERVGIRMLEGQLRYSKSNYIHGHLIKNRFFLPIQIN